MANELNIAAVVVLQKRIEQAKLDGSINIVVKADLLLELLRGTQEAMSKGWTSTLEV